MTGRRYVPAAVSVGHSDENAAVVADLGDLLGLAVTVDVGIAGGRAVLVLHHSGVGGAVAVQVGGRLADRHRGAVVPDHADPTVGRVADLALVVRRCALIGRCARAGIGACAGVCAGVGGGLVDARSTVLARLRPVAVALCTRADLIALGVVLDDRVGFAVVVGVGDDDRLVALPDDDRVGDAVMVAVVGGRPEVFVVQHDVVARLDVLGTIVELHRNLLVDRAGAVGGPGGCGGCVGGAGRVGYSIFASDGYRRAAVPSAVCPVSYSVDMVPEPPPVTGAAARGSGPASAPRFVGSSAGRVDRAPDTARSTGAGTAGRNCGSAALVTKAGAAEGDVAEAVRNRISESGDADQSAVPCRAARSSCPAPSRTGRGPRAGCGVQCVLGDHRAGSVRGPGPVGDPVAVGVLVVQR